MKMIRTVARPQEDGAPSVTKVLPYARIYLGDLLSQCMAAGFGLRECGLLMRLLFVQHVRGSIPADPVELLRLADDANPDEIEAVVETFFPLTPDGRHRVN